MGALLAAYDQLNSSVGQFATDTLISDSAALASGTATDDRRYQAEQVVLGLLANLRDGIATQMKQFLSDSVAASAPNYGGAQAYLAWAQYLLAFAHTMAAAS
jgi:hypothetical protein